MKDGDDWAEDLEQGYVAWRPGFASRWLLTFGKLNAPMGFELPDAPDMYQFSHALVFDLDLPLTPDENLTFGGEINKGVIKHDGSEQDWSGFLIMAHRVVNDWLGSTTRFDWFNSYPGHYFPHILGIRSGMPRTAFYSNYEPRATDLPNLLLVDKHGLLSCYGTLEGVFPALPCDPVGNSDESQGTVKTGYGK